MGDAKVPDSKNQQRPWLYELATKGHPRILAELKEHQPLIVLLSISLVVATFAPAGLSRDLAVGAFGSFLPALLISILVRIAPGGRANGFTVFFFLYLVIGFAALFGAGYFLVSETSLANNLRGLPIISFAFAFLGEDYVKGLKWAVSVQPRRLRIYVFQFLCVLGVVFTVYAAIWILLIGAGLSSTLASFGPVLSLFTLFALFGALAPAFRGLFKPVGSRIRSWLAPGS